jgi:hypothetical protein
MVKDRRLSPIISRAKRAGGLGQVVEHLPDKHEALNSNPSTAKRKENLRPLLIRACSLLIVFEKHHIVNFLQQIKNDIF